MNSFVPRPRLTWGHWMTLYCWAAPRRLDLPVPEERLFTVTEDTQVLAHCYWQPDRRVDRPLELHCQDVKGGMLRLIAALNEAQVELISLETEEPNLERVFLHLTGRELRD